MSSDKIIEWNKNGYPTEESLDKLEKILQGEDIQKAINAFYSALAENCFDCYGPTKVEVRGNVIDVWEYHTMGWSSNENIIRVLKQSWLWSMLLERYDNYGHYYFKPKKKILDGVGRG
jgi:hypothetical protein